MTLNEIDAQIEQTEKSLYEVGLSLKDAWNMPHSKASALIVESEKKTKELKQAIKKLKQERAVVLAKGDEE